MAAISESMLKSGPGRSDRTASTELTELSHLHGSGPVPDYILQILVFCQTWLVIVRQPHGSSAVPTSIVTTYEEKGTIFRLPIRK